MSMMDAGAGGATSIANTLLQLVITLLRDMMRFAVKVSGQLGNGTLHAAGALMKSAQERANRGQVGLSRFTQLAQSREPVHVTDREVAKILRGELKKHGVTFAVEKHLDGSVTYHAEGKDASVVAHALEQAEQRVDELNRSRGEALERGEVIPDGDEHHRIELTEEQAAQLAGELREYGQTLQESGRNDEARTVDSLAEQAEQNRAIPTDAESLELVEEARAAQASAPEHMQAVQESITDERATIGAEPYRALIDTSIEPESVTMDAQTIVPMTEAQSEQLVAAVRDHTQAAPEQTTGAPSQDAPVVDVDRAAALESFAADIELNQSVELTPATVEILHDTFEREGWQPGTAGDQTPAAMRDVVELIESERTVQQQPEREAPQQAAPTPDVERGAPVQEPAPAQDAPVIDAPAQADAPIVEANTARNSGADPFGADEWGDDAHDIDDPAPELTAHAVAQEAPAPTLPPKPTIPAAQAAREMSAKTQQAQPVQSPSTRNEREGSIKGEKTQKPSLGQVVGKIVQGRTEAAKKDAAARQAQRDAGRTPGQQTPQMPTGRSR